MSYCVNCGVELDRSERICPLCSVEVQNPLQPFDDQAERPYADKPDPVIVRTNRRFIAEIISIILAFPALLCAAVNVSLDGQLTWSLTVIGALLVAWTLAVPFYLYRRATLSKLFFPVLAAVLLYLLLIFARLGDLNTYLTLALPLAMLPACLLYLNGLLIVHKIVRGYVVPAILLVSIGFLVMGIELVIEWHAYGEASPDWSYFVLIPCLAFALIYLALARRQSIVEEINRRLHI